MDKNNHASGARGIKQNSARADYRDSLTEVYNKAYFQKRIKVFDSVRYYPLSVIICEINGLQLINSTLGSAKGDVLLVAAAKAIKDCIRKEDFVARVDDKFIILLPCTSSDISQLIIDRIQTACRKWESNASIESPCVSLSSGHATKAAAREDISEALAAAEKNLHKQKLTEQRSFHSSLLDYIREALIAKSHETEEHAQRLIKHSKQLGQKLGLSCEQLERLELLAAFHDIGKASIPVSILTKPGPLNELEWHAVRRHPETGYDIAISIPYLNSVAEEILCHHERWDGKGYPCGLSGNDIPLLSRIIAVADAFDAMTSKRCYKDAAPVKEALKEIKRNSGEQFDPVIAKTFIKLKKRYK